MEAFAFWLRFYWRLVAGLPITFAGVWLLLAPGNGVPFLLLPIFAYGFSMAARDEKVWLLPDRARPVSEYDTVYGLGLVLAAIAALAPIVIQVLRLGFTEQNLLVGAIVGAFVAAYIVYFFWHAKARRQGK